MPKVSTCLLLNAAQAAINAKSTLAAALALYHLFADREPNPRIYIAATVLEQCRETFEILTRMCAAVPSLDRNTRIVDSQNRKEVARYRDGVKVGYISALTSRGSKEGKNPSVVIFDELCDWTEAHRQLWNSMTMGSFARQQPLFLVTTTAGTDLSTLCREQYEYAKKIQAGHLEDPQFLPYIIEADPKLWNDPQEQVRCNPLVQEGFIPEESIRGEFLQAQAGPAELSKFKAKRLNIWVGSSVGFLDMQKWYEQTERIDDAHLVGLPCTAGLDLATRDDLCALVLLFADRQASKPTRYYVKPYFWLPEAGMIERQKRDGHPYDLWIEQGHLYLSPGEVVDYHLILAKLKELSATYRISEVSFDEWNADYVAQDIEKAGWNIAPHRQGMKSMSPPLKELAALVLEKRLVHSLHPVLGWNAQNLNVKTDDAGNVKPTKKNRRSKIDGIVALTMALSSALRNESRPKMKSSLEWLMQAS